MTRLMILKAEDGLKHNFAFGLNKNTVIVEKKSNSLNFGQTDNVHN